MGNPSYNCVFGGLRLWRRFMFRPPWPFHTPRACLACGARPRCMCRSAAVMWCVGGCVPPRMVTVPASRTRSSVLSAPLQDAFTPVASTRTPPFFLPISSPLSSPSSSSSFAPWAASGPKLLTATGPKCEPAFVWYTARACLWRVAQASARSSLYY